jgi:hypothetical protein
LPFIINIKRLFVLVQPSNNIAIVTQVRFNKAIKSFSETLTLLSIYLATVSSPTIFLVYLAERIITLNFVFFEIVNS